MVCQQVNGTPNGLIVRRQFGCILNQFIYFILFYFILFILIILFILFKFPSFLTNSPDYLVAVYSVELKISNSS